MPGFKLSEVVVAEVLAAVEARRASLREVMERYFKRFRELEVIKGLVRAYSLAVLRNFKLLDFIASRELGIRVEELDFFKRNLLRAVVYEAAFRDVSIERLEKASKPLKVAARDLVKLRDLSIDRLLKPLPVLERLSVRYSQPKWVVEYLVKLLGLKEAMELLRSFNRPATVWIRVNTLKITRRELARSLRRRGLLVVEDEDLPDVLKVLKLKSSLSRLPEHEKGFFYIQDKASALVAHVLSPQENADLVDLCAAPGGKATHAAQLTKCKVKILALDLSARRMAVLKKLAFKLGVHCIDAVVADSRTPPLRGKFDNVVVDPDCSSLGKLGHSPEIRLWTPPRYVEEYAALQRELLKKGLKLLKPGGKLIYSTCTFTLEENEQLVKEVCDEVGGVEPAEQTPFIGDPGFEDLVEAQRLFPHRHSTQGFFIAELRKA